MYNSRKSTDTTPYVMLFAVVFIASYFAVVLGSLTVALMAREWVKQQIPTPVQYERKAK